TSTTTTTTLKVDAFAIKVQFHYLANGSSSGWSSTNTVGDSGQITINKQGMGRNLIVNPGDILRVGYRFKMPGQHPDILLLFKETTVTFQALCASGSGDEPIVVE